MGPKLPLSQNRKKEAKIKRWGNSEKKVEIKVKTSRGKTRKTKSEKKEEHLSLEIGAKSKKRITEGQIDLVFIRKAVMSH